MSGLSIDLTGKRALVTGGSRGVGESAALLLARAGADVGISYRSREEDAARVVDALRALGRTAWSQSGDLAEPASVEALFQRVDQEFDGQLDIFVGNAGIWPPEDVALEEMGLDRWRQTLAVNLDSIFLTTREALRRMNRDGRVILVSSTAGQRGEAYHGDYAATKGAMISLVKGLCVEVGSRGITVNAVAPGWIETEMSQDAFQGGGRERIAATIPIGRIASADDVAGPILLLCSPLARHITGEIVNVNGGAVLVG
ncbi:MAG: SDR family oxidoreductase [Gemmatimonadetes bacterium]|nr:SDR family oxidoreductase [Gemmatimonadota bacterium]